MSTFPYDASQVIAYGSDVVKAYNEAGRLPDIAATDWVGRMQYDAVFSGYPYARAKQLAALRSALGLGKPPTTGLVDNLRVRGNFFETTAGARFTAIECSDFALLAKYQAGSDITPVLAQRAACGFNMLRVWTAFDAIPGIGTFTTIDYAGVPAFVALCANYGLYVEFTAYTGWNDPTHWGQLCAAAAACPIAPLLELVNELDANTNEPDALGRVFDLSLYAQAPPPLLSSHGSNGSQAHPVRPWWSYEEFHTNDAPEWPRKVGHNAMECSEGAEGIEASQVPTLTNENTRYDDKAQSPQWAYDGAAGAALLCAGSCYHSVCGKSGDVWTDEQAACAQQWAAGARSVDLACQDGYYRHASELETPDLLRVYQRIVGQTAYTVEIRR